MGDVKFAVVQVQGDQRMIDLFTLLVNNGYGNVAFVSSLADTLFKTEHSQTQPQPRPTSPVQLPPMLQQVKQEQRREESEESPRTSPSRPANAADRVMQHLLGGNADAENDGSAQLAANQQLWVLPTGEIPAPSMVMQPPPPMMMMQSMGAMVGTAGGGFGSSPPRVTRSTRPSRSVNNVVPATPSVRMKGWQRDLLKEAMKNGVPKGAVLARLCLEAQVTETQATNFFRKRTYARVSGGQSNGDGEDNRDESPDEEFVFPPENSGPGS